MNINYDEMLKKLDRPQDMIETISFTEEEFETLASKMADLGYIHTKASLSAEQLLERYGVRTVDRMHELTTVIEFKGKSLRRTRPNAIAVSDHKKEVAQRKALEELAKAHERYRNEHPNTDDDGAPF